MFSGKRTDNIVMALFVIKCTIDILVLGIPSYSNPNLLLHRMWSSRILSVETLMPLEILIPKSDLVFSKLRNCDICIQIFFLSYSSRTKDILKLVLNLVLTSCAILENKLQIFENLQYAQCEENDVSCKLTPKIYCLWFFLRSGKQ